MISNGVEKVPSPKSLHNRALPLTTTTTHTHAQKPNSSFLSFISHSRPMPWRRSVAQGTVSLCAVVSPSSGFVREESGDDASPSFSWDAGPWDGIYGGGRISSSSPFSSGSSQSSDGQWTYVLCDWKRQQTWAEWCLDEQAKNMCSEHVLVTTCSSSACMKDNLKPLREAEHTHTHTK